MKRWLLLTQRTASVGRAAPHIHRSRICACAACIRFLPLMLSFRANSANAVQRCLDTSTVTATSLPATLTRWSNFFFHLKKRANGECSGKNATFGSNVVLFIGVLGHRQGGRGFKAGKMQQRLNVIAASFQTDNVSGNDSVAGTIMVLGDAFTSSMTYARRRGKTKTLSFV